MKNRLRKSALLCAMSLSLLCSHPSPLPVSTHVAYASDDDVPAPDPDVEEAVTEGGIIEHEAGEEVNLFADAGKIEPLPEPVVQETDPPLPTADEAKEDKSTVDRQQDGVYGTIVRVRTGYVFSDGSFVEWTSGVGFLVSKDKLLTAKSLVEVGQKSTLYKNILAQYEGAYKENGVDLADYGSVKKNLRTYIVADAGDVQCEINPDASGDAFALMDLETPVNAYATAVFADGMPAEGDEIGVTGTMMTDSATALQSTNIYIKKANVTAIRKSGQALYIDFEGSFSTLSPGSPIVDQDKNIIGMITDGASGRGSALSLESIRGALDTVNIEYSVANDAGVDLSDLEEVIAQAKDMDLTDITEDSIAAINDALKAGIAVTEESMPSRRRVEEAVQNINTAMSNIAYIDHSGEQLAQKLKMAGIVVVVLLCILIPLIIKESRKMHYQRKEDLQKLANFILGKKSGDAPVKKKKDTKKDKNKGKANDNKPQQDAGQTTVLKRPQRPQSAHAYLLDKKKEERIEITHTPFTIGILDECDLCIPDNTAVSRNHCEITAQGGTYYIMDCKSTNGTMLDGVEIKPKVKVELKDRVMITVADVEYIFRIEDAQ